MRWGGGLWEVSGDFWRLPEGSSFTFFIFICDDSHIL